MKYIRKFNESIDIYNIDWKSIVPKSLSVIKDNRTTSFTIGNIMKNFDMIQITYDTTGGEIWGYPDTLEFDLYFAKPIKDEMLYNILLIILNLIHQIQFLLSQMRVY